MYIGDRPLFSARAAFIGALCGPVLCMRAAGGQIKSLNHTGDVKALVRSPEFSCRLAPIGLPHIWPDRSAKAAQSPGLATSAPGLHSILPHLHRDCALLCLFLRVQLARSGSVFLNNVNFDASSLGRKFSFVISHSILSHAAAWQLEQYFENTAAVLERGGVSLASLIMGETDSNSAHWIYPGGTQFTAETIQRAAERVGVEIERMPWYTVMLRALTKHETHDWLKITRP